MQPSGLTSAELFFVLNIRDDADSQRHAESIAQIFLSKIFVEDLQIFIGRFDGRQASGCQRRYEPPGRTCVHPRKQITTSASNIDQ
jgi:hypothetical protein